MTELRKPLLIGFDFDSTLGKVTPEIDQEMIELISKSTGASEESISLHIPTIKPYSLAAHLSSIGHEPGSLVHIDLTNFLKERFKSILFSDTIPTLTKLKSDGSKLVVITYGGEDYQSLKIKATGLDALVDRCYITTAPLSKASAINSLFHQYPAYKILYVDNTIEELESIESIWGDKVSLLLIQRLELAKSRQKSKYPTISNLTEIFNYIA